MAATPSKPEFPLYTAQTSRSYQLLDWKPKYDLHLISVDPGGEHVGVAAFGHNADGWECTWAGEMTPEEFEDWLSEQYICGRVDILVVEEWRLFADKAMQQTGSHMETSQLIGVIKYIHRSCKAIAARWPAPEVELVWQTPAIKNPTRAVLKNRGYVSMAKFLKIPNDHAADAELHGYHHILHTLKGTIHQHTLTKLKARA